jgi:CRISPR/Cas system CSM-associated protein Csm2 small subunit
MFNTTNQTVDTRMAVMEEKFSVYEKMMDKLESAIQTISEINQNISRMLTVHEEKIDNSTKTDEIIFEKLRRIEQKNTEEHQKVVDRLEKLEVNIKTTIETEKKEREENIDEVTGKINDVVKFRWLVVGGLAVAMFAFTNSSIIIDVLTPDQNPATIHKVK